MTFTFGLYAFSLHVWLWMHMCLVFEIINICVCFKKRECWIRETAQLVLSIWARRPSLIPKLLLTFAPKCYKPSPGAGKPSRWKEGANATSCPLTIYAHKIKWSVVIPDEQHLKLFSGFHTCTWAHRYTHNTYTNVLCFLKFTQWLKLYLKELLNILFLY